MNALQTYLTLVSPKIVDVEYVRHGNKYFIATVSFEHVTISFNPPWTSYSIPVQNTCNEVVYDRYTVRYSLDSEFAQCRLRYNDDEADPYLLDMTQDVVKRIPLCFFPPSWTGRWVQREIVAFTRGEA